MSAWKAAACRSSISFDVVRELGGNARGLLEGRLDLARRPTRRAGSGARCRARRSGTRRACGGRTAPSSLLEALGAGAHEVEHAAAVAGAAGARSLVQRAVVGAVQALERHARVRLGRVRSGGGAPGDAVRVGAGVAASRSCRPCATPRSRARARPAASCRRSRAPRAGRPRRRSGCRRPRSCAGGSRSGRTRPRGRGRPARPRARCRSCARARSARAAGRARARAASGCARPGSRAPVPMGAQASGVTPFGTYAKASRSGACSVAAKAGRIASSQGSAIPAPRPRSTVRRDRCFCVTKFTTPSPPAAPGTADSSRSRARAPKSDSRSGAGSRRSPARCGGRSAPARGRART